MKRFAIALSAGLLVIVASAARAERPADKTPPTSIISQGEVTPTPEMWFYQQYQKQYQNPQDMVHRNADIKGAERLRRLNALKWYGMSNQRPRTGVDPINGDYAPTWVSGNVCHPNQWYSTGGPVVVFAR
jgi:hypothetical protein